MPEQEHWHWVGVAAHIAAAEAYSDAVWKLKQHSPMTRNMGGRLQAHVEGYLGEMVFSLHTGAPLVKPPPGTPDGGIDFTIGGQTIDVKTSTFLPDPALKYDPHLHHALTAQWVALVVLDRSKNRGALLGSVKTEQLTSAPLVTFDEKLGPCHTLGWRDLIPPFCPKTPRQRCPRPS